MSLTDDRVQRSTRTQQASGGNGGSILVVDDEPGVLLTIRAILAQEGYSVDGAPNGGAAIDMLRRRTYDLVLTDLRLGDVDGLDVLAEVRRASPRTVAIVLTGYASLESAIQAMREGAYDYLVKPTDVEELKLRVAHVFERHRLADELAKRVRELEEANTTIDHMNGNLRHEVDRATAQLRERVDELDATKTALETEKVKKERFIAMVAHDLRAPLAPIKLATQIIPRRHDLPEDVLRHVATIEEQADRMERLITDLMDMSRIDTGQFTLKRDHCDLSDLVEKQIEHYRLAHPDFIFEAHLPETPITGAYDRVRLAQAINNLIDNAVKYSLAGTTITIALSHVAEGGCAIAVADEGMGIPQDKLNEIFDPFRRLEGTEQIIGFGLGLYITKGIVEAHGGTLTVESGANRAHGAIFILTLPAA